jgi:hypothetical protein
MSLASLTVDLNLSLAKFEGDSGKAAQVVTRDTETMSRAARNFEKALQRVADQSTKTNSETLTIKAAMLGLGDSTLELIQKVSGAGGAFAAVGTAGKTAFTSVSVAADEAAAKSSALLATVVAKIRDVNAQADALRTAAKASNAGGSLSDSGLAAELSSINARREAALRLVQDTYAQEKATQQAAAAEIAANAQRAASFEALRDKVAKLAYAEQQAALAQQNAKAAAVTASNDAFVAGLQRQVDAIGKSRAELLALEAAQRGVGTEAAPLIARLAAAEKTTSGFAKTAKLTAFETQQLGFQVHDFAVQVASGQSPLTAFVQQGSQLSGTFGGAGNAAKVLLSFVTPLRVALTGGAAAAGALALAFYEGSRQSKAFADAIVLTGGYAGVTEGRFNALARGIAASGEVSVAAAREFGQALINTGEVGPRALASATAAAAKYGEATGKNAKEVAQDYAQMGADVAKWASEHNRQLNFLSAAQYDQIKSLQDQGKAADAQAIVYDALNKRFSNLQQNLGTIETVLKTTKNAWSSFWDAALDIGRAETIEDKIAKNTAAIQRFEAARKSAAQPGEGFQVPGLIRAPVGPKTADQLREDNVELQRLKIAQDNAAASVAERAAVTQRAIAGKDLVRSFLTEGKAASQYQAELVKLKQAFEDNAAAGTPFTSGQQADALAALKKKFTDTSAQGESNAQRKALLDQDVKFIRENFAQQKDALEFGQQQLQAVYASGTLSLSDYYAARRAAIAAGTQAELNALSDEQSRLEVELERGAFKDPHEKIQLQTQLNDVIAKSAKTALDASRAATLAALDQAAAEKALQERVVSYYADLLTLEGDDLNASRLRTQAAVAAAAVIAKASQGSASPISDDDLARQTRALQTASDYAEVQRRVGVATADASRAEEAFLLRSQQAGANLIETDTGLYTLRAAALVQLGELADKARELAEASTDPKIIAYAKDLALQYAKAADAVDPAITRLRSGADDLAVAYRGVFDSIASGSLTGGEALKQLAKTTQQTLTKTFISDPLEAALKGGLRKLVDGDGIGTFLRGGAPSSQPGAGIDVASANYSPAKDSQAASEAFDALQSSLGTVVSTTVTQTAATQTATSALSGMALAAQGAAQALASVATSGGYGSLFKYAGSSNDPSAANYTNSLDQGFTLADGTNYVPYDGMKAVLHKGESVTPAKYNPAAGGQSPGGRASITINNHASDTTEASAKQNSDGSIEVLMRKIVRDENARDMRSGSGPLSSGLKGRGVRLDNGNPRRA